MPRSRWKPIQGPSSTSSATSKPLASIGCRWACKASIRAFSRRSAGARRSGARAAGQAALTIFGNVNFRPDVRAALASTRRCTSRRRRGTAVLAAAFCVLSSDDRAEHAVPHPRNCSSGEAEARGSTRIAAYPSAPSVAKNETSAHAKPGFECRHNLNYWRFGDYLGIGAGAHSKLSFRDRVIRQVRYKQPQQYIGNALSGAPLIEIMKSRATTWIRVQRSTHCASRPECQSRYLPPHGLSLHAGAKGARRGGATRAHRTRPSSLAAHIARPQVSQRSAGAVSATRREDRPYCCRTDRHGATRTMTPQAPMPTVMAAAAALRSGRETSEALTLVMLNRINATDANVQAWAHYRQAALQSSGE